MSTVSNDNGLELNQDGLARLEKIADSAGVVSSSWVLRMIAEIRHLRDENVRLRDNVRDEALKMVEDMYPSSEVR